MNNKRKIHQQLADEWDKSNPLQKLKVNWKLSLGYQNFPENKLRIVHFKITNFSFKKRPRSFKAFNFFSHSGISSYS